MRWPSRPACVRMHTGPARGSACPTRRLDAPGRREGPRHVPSPQGVPEDQGRRSDRLAPWDLQDRPPLWDQVGQSPPAGQKEEVRVSPTDCSPRGSPHRVGARRGGKCRWPGSSRPSPVPAPGDFGAHSRAHGPLFSQWPLVEHLLAELGALTCYFPTGQGTGGGGRCLLLPKPREVPERPRSPADCSLRVSAHGRSTGCVQRLKGETPPHWLRHVQAGRPEPPGRGPWGLSEGGSRGPARPWSARLASPSAWALL